MTKIMVVGASGVLGKLICHELLRIYKNHIELIVTDYRTERGEELANSLNSEVKFQHVDINDQESVETSIKEIDVVVVVVKQRTPLIQRICIKRGILCIDVTPFYDFVKEVKQLDQSAKINNTASVVMAGFFPGLSGLMVKEAVLKFEEVTEVNVALLQNTNATAGISGILDKMKIIDFNVYYKNNDISGFTEKRKMYFLDHLREKEVRLIDHAEKSLLNDIISTKRLNYWTAWNSSSFNTLVSILRQVGLTKKIDKLNKGVLSKLMIHNAHKDEYAFLTVEVKGMMENREVVKYLSLRTDSDYQTTAMVTAALTKIILNKKIKGALTPFEVTNISEVTTVINSNTILVEETLHDIE
ncbi:hypothetical protein JCM10914A_47330 [Paenibacillus sp. JCM 10914]|uniref:saccharopine dehydrogenase NADP-binding domain-containing protein n=1 Tax=Paenibacillus sp. JCM 10914 TaxID=1236974 RepID=UPI0003CC7A3C|nr:saccharopine dehydrogenase NADP-binding domain-containing protein [Paenibacillus sp. JCM 10914]GAE08073.1 hypothetical protein JCM10914_4332 [Paenibacillus sp. JCM 10914]